MIPVIDTAPAALAVSDILGWAVQAPVSAFHAYGELLRWATHAVRDLFDSYGYWVVFLGCLFENTLFIGLVVPGVIVLLLAGISAGNGDMSPLIAFGLAFLGTVIGDTISYFLGRFGWNRLIEGTSAHEFTERIRDPIMRRGVWFVMLYHFAGYTRLLGPASAGILRMPYRRWAPADHFGALLWTGSHIALGYGLGRAGVNFDSVDRYFKYVEWVLLALVLVYFGYLYRTGMHLLLHGHDDTRESDETAEAV